MTTPLQPQMIETAVEVVVDRRPRSASYSGLIETPQPQRSAGVGVASKHALCLTPKLYLLALGIRTRTQSLRAPVSQVASNVSRGFYLFIASQTLILCYTEAKCSMNAVQQVAVKMVAHSVAAQDKLENDHVRAIATLSEKLKVPEHEVVDIFRKEFERLATHARISTFLIVLAMRNTRSILRGRGAGETCLEGVLSKKQNRSWYCK